ncbi:MAG: hypothetical protein R6W75_02895 [Smithellaceae bacterium]
MKAEETQNGGVPRDRDPEMQSVKKLEDIKKAADKASAREDFAFAGKSYHLLLKSYPDFKDIAHLLSFDRAQLQTNLAACQTALYKKGFQEYREGNLNEAVALWQDYLVIDPDNADIRKALNTARTQQKNLQQKN